MRFSNERRNLSDPNQFALDGASRPGGIPADEDVYFRANAEIFEVDPRFDRKQRAGEYAAFVVRLEIVHICSGAVHFGSD